ncbi:MAG: hypothetical protein V1772_03425 [Chloroflexota bacterium]
MVSRPRPPRRHAGRLFARQTQVIRFSPDLQFWRAVFRLIAQYWPYGVAILAVTILQEVSSLWPVTLLGQFVDRLQTGELGNVVWLLLGASIVAPGVARLNVIVRHKMFYDTEYDERVRMILELADRGDCAEAEAASAAHTRVINAVSGITNASYHVLGSFTPLIIKLTLVTGRLLAYNRTIGLVYLASLILPGLLTILFNKWLRVLRDAQYEIMSTNSGVGVRAIMDGQKHDVRHKFIEVTKDRTRILFSLTANHQVALYVREAALVGCQFIVVFLALQMREQIGLTPGDFTKIVGYTAQVGGAVINTAAVLDAIISHSRAYHVFDQAHPRRTPPPPPKPAT